MEGGDAVWTVDKGDGPGTRDGGRVRADSSWEHTECGWGNGF
jgi:hypothetical protein